MAQTECPKCNGRGKMGVAELQGLQDLPFMMRPIGIVYCLRCGGSGKVGFTEEAIERMKTFPTSLRDSDSFKKLVEFAEEHYGEKK